MRLGDFEQAAKYFDKSLESHSSPSFGVQNYPRFVRVLAGEMDREDYFSWVGSLSEQPRSKWARPAFLMALMVPDGLDDGFTHGFVSHSHKEFAWNDDEIRALNCSNLHWHNTF